MNRLGVAAALTGFSGVALGAFGAHALGDKLSVEAQGWWDTATAYALPHAMAAMAIALSGARGVMRHSGWAFVIGALIFAATLYGLALGAPRWTGAITPLGGLGMLTGWGLAAWGFLRSAD